MVKVYLDAGHGGKDGGAVGNGLVEKSVVLNLAKRIENKLKEYKNVEVLQTRTTDKFLSLSARADKANSWGADCFISLHLNAHTAPSANGFESYIYNGSVSPQTVAFQNVIHEEVMRQIGKKSPDRGKKRANFAVLRETSMIALLGENLFVSNPTDANLLKQTVFLDSLAQGYVVGLEKFFGLERTIRPPTEETPNTGEIYYQVVCGSFTSRENAEDRVKHLKADGYNSFIQEKE